VQEIMDSTINAEIFNQDEDDSDDFDKDAFSDVTKQLDDEIKNL
jgi:hypothetical protein